jgi:hypothetical protein
MPRGIYPRANRKYHCKHCSRAFKFAWQIAQHVKLEHPDKVKSKLKKGEQIANSKAVANEAEGQAFNLGYACASVQALIAHLAERDGISQELLSARIIEFLSGSALRRKSRSERSL